MALGYSNCVCFLIKSTVFDHVVIYTRREKVDLGMKWVEVSYSISALFRFDVSQSIYYYSPGPGVNCTGPRFIEVDFWTSVCNRDYFTTVWCHDY